MIWSGQVKVLEAYFNNKKVGALAIVEYKIGSTMDFNLRLNYQTQLSGFTCLRFPNKRNLYDRMLWYKVVKPSEETSSTFIQHTGMRIDTQTENFIHSVHELHSIRTYKCVVIIKKKLPLHSIVKHLRVQNVPIFKFYFLKLKLFQVEQISTLFY